MWGKFSGNLGLLKNMMEWLHFHVKRNIWKPSSLKWTNTMLEIAWNCKNFACLFKFNLFLSWKAIQKMDGKWSAWNLRWSIPTPKVW